MRKGKKNNNYHKPTVLPSFAFCFSPSSKTLVLPYFLLTTAVIVVLHTPPFEALSIYLFISCYRDYQPSSVLRRSGTEENKNKSFFRHIFFLATYSPNQSINTYTMATTTTTLHNVDLRNHHLEKDPCIINTVSFHSDDTSSSDIDDESQLQEPHHEKPKSKHHEIITHDHHDYHPLRTQITSQTNDFILTHWSFSSSSSSSATSYLATDLPGLASKFFPCALDDRIHLLARLFSIVFLLGEEIDALVRLDEHDDDERDDECDEDDEERDAEREGLRKEIIQFLKESFNGVYGRRRIDREEEEEEEEFPLVWMLNHVLDEMASHAYLLVMGEVQEAIWRFLGTARRRGGEKNDDEDALSRFRAKFVDAGMWLPLYRFATGEMVDEEEFGFGGVEMVEWSGVVGGGGL